MPMEFCACADGTPLSDGAVLSFLDRNNGKTCTVSHDHFTIEVCCRHFETDRCLSTFFDHEEEMAITLDGLPNRHRSAYLQYQYFPPCFYRKEASCKILLVRRKRAEYDHGFIVCRRIADGSRCRLALLCTECSSSMSQHCNKSS